ncbi:hypothetical protein [Candidatus Uabimicrobium sp. HlEnr_7]|uniref:hypothetical protein n=1 Tax=Candidatus Uabimicrobium helgolandensis TaxID=3095367 RepID=UPI0035588D72
MINKKLDLKKCLIVNILPFASIFFLLLATLALKKGGNGVGSVGAAVGIAEFLMVCFLFFVLYALFFSSICLYFYSFKDSTNDQNRVWYFFKLLLLTLILTPLFFTIVAFCIDNLRNFSFFYDYYWLIWGFGLLFVSTINSLLIPYISLKRVRVNVVIE